MAEVPNTQPEKPSETEKLLGQILQQLKIINHRERWRAVGGTFHFILGLIPVLLIIYTMWIAYYSADSLMDQVVRRVVNSFTQGGAASSSSVGTAQPTWQDFLQQIMQQQKK